MAEKPNTRIAEYNATGEMPGVGEAVIDKETDTLNRYTSKFNAGQYIIYAPDGGVYCRIDWASAERAEKITDALNAEPARYEILDNEVWECKVANGEIVMLYVESLEKIEILENRLSEQDTARRAFKQGEAHGIHEARRNAKQPLHGEFGFTNGKPKCINSNQQSI